MNNLIHSWKRHALIISIGALSLVFSAGAFSDFVNGDFATGDFTGWAEGAYLVPNDGMSGVFPPETEADLQLSPAGAPKSAVLAPGSAASTGGALSWLGNAARVHDEISGFNRTVSSIEQTITVAAGDIDADGKVHVRFTAAPVLEDPNHQAHQQPYFFIEITGPGGVSLYHTYNFAGEVGVPWQVAGNYTFTDWQAFDIALDPNVVGVGDPLTFKAFAAGCSPTAHAGALYLKGLRTDNVVAGASLWITAAGPAQVCVGNQATYTYTYENNGTDPMTDVLVEVGMPETNDPMVTSFVSISNPSFGGGTCAAPASPGDPATCDIGTLLPGESGTFTMTVTVPPTATGTSLNHGNYTISGEDPVGNLVTQLGPLVRAVLCMAPAIPVPATGLWALLLLSLLILPLGMMMVRTWQAG